MTHAEQILKAVSQLVQFDTRSEFTRDDIRRRAGITREEWVASYSPIFQGMRADQPGGAPDVPPTFKNVFCRVRHGDHTLTEHGKKLIAEVSAANGRI